MPKAPSKAINIHWNNITLGNYKVLNVRYMHRKNTMNLKTYELNDKSSLVKCFIKLLFPTNS